MTIFNRKGKTILFNLILTALAVSVALFLAEGVLWMQDYPHEPEARVAHPPLMDEVRTDLEFEYRFQTNAQGLRYRAIPLERQPDERRIFVVGDSFTEGYGVDVEDRFTNRLEGMFSTPEHPVYFINGGLSGTGPLHYGRMFRHVGLTYHPDALLICLYANDLANMPEVYRAGQLDGSASARTGMRAVLHNLWPRLYTLLQTYRSQQTYREETRTTDFVATISEEARRQGIAEDRIAEWREVLDDELVAAINRGAFNGALLSNGLLYPAYWTDALDLSSERAETKWTNMTHVLSEVLTLAERHDLPVAMVFIPDRFQYDPAGHAPDSPRIQSGMQIRSDWLTETTELQYRLDRWTQERKVPFLDLTQTFREAVRSGLQLNWKKDGHWNAAGHDVAATAIADWLDRQKGFLN